jgi:hypothetical protein
MAQAKKWKTSIRVVDPTQQPPPKPPTVKTEVKEDDDEEEEEEEVGEVERSLGSWLDEHDIFVETKPGRPGPQRKAGANDEAKPPKPPKPAGPPREPRAKRNPGKAALAGLAIDLDLDQGKATDTVEFKARLLVGRRGGAVQLESS